MACGVRQELKLQGVVPLSSSQQCLNGLWGPSGIETALSLPTTDAILKSKWLVGSVRN